MAVFEMTLCTRRAEGVHHHVHSQGAEHLQGELRRPWLRGSQQAGRPSQRPRHLPDLRRRQHGAAAAGKAEYVLAIKLLLNIGEVNALINLVALCVSFAIINVLSDKLDHLKECRSIKTLSEM